MAAIERWTQIRGCLVIYGQHAKNVAKTMPLLHGLMEDKTVFYSYCGWADWSENNATFQYKSQ